jgi:two-component system invasion response regulator UvrY
MPRTCRVLIVDDHPVFRHGLRRVIETDPRLQCVGEATDAPEARRLLSELRVDLMTVDLSLPAGSGLDLLHATRTEHPATRTLVVSMCDEVLYGPRALRAGAMGFVSKGATADTLREGIVSAWRGRPVVSEALRERLGQRAIAPTTRPQGIESLTDRELDVLRGIATGRDTAAIASALAIAIKTVETHRTNICRKLGVRGTAALVRAAIAALDVPLEPGA